MECINNRFCSEQLVGGVLLKKFRVGLILIVILACVIASCAGPIASSEQRTLGSLQKLDDFPLYQMYFYGDYGFWDYLQRGGGEIGEGGQVESNPVVRDWACTGFAALGATGDKFLGRNFDWYYHPVLILFTDPPGAYASVSMVDISYLGIERQILAGERPRALLKAPFLPFDGMNENGLAVGMMAVPHAEGGRDSQKMTLEDLEVIRLLLDYARNVSEAIKLLQNYNVRFGEVPIHYLLADRQGNSAVIEYLGDEMRVIANTLPWQVSTNFLVSEQKPEGSDSSCWRYNTAYSTLEEVRGVLSPEEAMELLSEVSQSGDFPTIWSVVYNLSRGQVRVVIDRHYQDVYTFSVGLGAIP
jgi:hypothetical protein